MTLYTAGQGNDTSSASSSSPGSNGTTSSLSAAPPVKKFLMLCGRDYSSKDGAQDLAHAEAPSMAACLDLCAAQPACVAAGWGNYNGQWICWMKSVLGRPNWSDNWYMAVQQP